MKVWVAAIILLLANTMPSSRASALASHPRLFFTLDDLPAMRQEALTTHRQIWTAILAYADSLVGTAPPVKAPRGIDDGQYRDYGNQLIPIAFVCTMTESPVYCDLTRTYLLAYARWDRWEETQQRDLATAHFLVGYALAYDWIYRFLTPQEQYIVQDTLANWTHKMYRASTEPYSGWYNNWWPDSYAQNHNWINHSAMGLAALALIEPNNESISEGTKCSISSTQAVNLRLGANLFFPVMDTLSPGKSAYVVAQTTDPQGIVWWLTDQDLWVRSDVVTESGPCGQLSPLVADAPLWLNRARQQLEKVQALLNGVGDGTWHEGLLYQTYGLTMMLPFLINLRDLMGVDLLPNRYLQNYVLWRLYNDLPGTTDFVMSYSDMDWSWGNAYEVQHILRFLAHQYQDGHAAWLADQIDQSEGWQNTIWATPWYVFEFLAYDPTVVPKPPTDLPLSRTFPDLQGVIWRTGWSPSDYVFALKTGPVGGRYAFETFTRGLFPWQAPCLSTGCTFNVGHDHNDTNTFYLYGNGQWIIPENAGMEKTAAAFHNVIEIDGQDQVSLINVEYKDPASFMNRDGSLDAAVSTSSYDFLVADATRRYSISDLQDVTRSVLFIRPNLILMLDHIAALNPHQYDWIAHFPSVPTLAENWVQAGVPIQIIAPTHFEAQMGNDGLPFMKVTSQSGIFVTAFYLSANRPSISLVEDNGRALLLQIDGQEDVLFSYAEPTSVVTMGSYEFDGKVAVIGRNLFFYGGTYLKQAGRTLISGQAAAVPYEAVNSR